MTYNEVLEKARTNIGPYCKACPVCNGKACGNAMPGPGSKNPGNGRGAQLRRLAARLREHGHDMRPRRAYDGPQPLRAASSACPSSRPR